jgi:hypothetical protein
MRLSRTAAPSALTTLVGALVGALEGKVVGDMDVQVQRPSPTGGAKGTL